MPGTIIRAIRDAGSSNPVFMIDEIDKMGSDWRVTLQRHAGGARPEQNTSFRDHYLDLPYDLSKAMFICTANILDTVPEPLRDAWRSSPSPGTPKKRSSTSQTLPGAPAVGAERRQQRAAHRHRQRLALPHRELHPGGRSTLAGAPDRLHRPQVRPHSSRRRDGAAHGRQERVVELLGKAKVFRETKRRTSEPGVSTGLAWTPTGGDILFIEARATPGSAISSSRTTR